MIFADSSMVPALVMVIAKAEIELCLCKPPTPTRKPSDPRTSGPEKLKNLNRKESRILNLKP